MKIAQALLRNTLWKARTVGRAYLDENRIMAQLIRGDGRREMFWQAIDFVNFERVPGAIMEFGVFAGNSLALLAKAQCNWSFEEQGMNRRIVGFDSFQGLPTTQEEHARFRPGWFATTTDHWGNPLLQPGARVTSQAVLELFRVCELPKPALEVGPFEETIPKVVPSEYPEGALLHIDCDLYESARQVFKGIAPALQEGTMILFDDWFCYKGSQQKGEARAFREFLEVHAEWIAVHYKSYCTFGNSFVMTRA